MAHTKGLVVVALLLLAALALGPASAQDDRPQRVANVSLDDEGCPEGPDRFCVRPHALSLEEGTDLVLRVTNEGRIAHNLTFAEGSPQGLVEHGMDGTLAPNQSRQLEIPWTAFAEAEQDEATLVCGQDGHASLGERLTVRVPSLAASEERPQPSLGWIGALATLGVAAFIRRRR